MDEEVNTSAASEVARVEDDSQVEETDDRDSSDEEDSEEGAEDDNASEEEYNSEEAEWEDAASDGDQSQSPRPHVFALRRSAAISRGITESSTAAPSRRQISLPPSPPGLYQPLNTKGNEIRVLRIFPETRCLVSGRDTDQIQCMLHHISLDEEIDYHALSYTWQDDELGSDFPNPDKDSRHPEAVNLIKNDEYIYLDGHRVPVSRNLWCVLWHLRRNADWHHWNPKATCSEFNDTPLTPAGLFSVFRRETWLWIDALCIDQSSVLERNEQVSKMLEIYRKAVCVHAWLGPPCLDSGEMVDLVLHLESLRLKMPRVEQINMLTDLISGWIQDSQYQPIWEALCCIYLRPYWGRVWIIQELMASPRTIMHIGLRTVPFDPLMLLGLLALQQAAQHLGAATSLEWKVVRSLPNRHIPKDRSEYRNPDFQGHDLFTLLKKYREQECSNPRDLVYGLLGLARPYQGVKTLRVDYSLTVNKVFLSTARYIIQGSNRLEIICNPQRHMCICNTGRHARSKLPSWVPDWQCEADIDRLFDNDSDYNASADRPPSPIFSTDETFLTCRGLFLGTISKFYRFLDWRRASEKDLPDYFRNIVTLLNDFETNPPLSFAGCRDSVDRLKVLYDILFRFGVGRTRIVISEENFVEYCTSLDNYHFAEYVASSSSRDELEQCSPEQDSEYLPQLSPSPSPQSPAHSTTPPLSHPSPLPSPTNSPLHDIHDPTSYNALTLYRFLSRTAHSKVLFTTHNPSEPEFQLTPHLTSSLSTISSLPSSTSTPIIGLSYPSCWEGDTIAIIYGCQYPVVLRLVEARSGRYEGASYEVIGEVYIHGYMHGEALCETLKQSADFEEREWKLI